MFYHFAFTEQNYNESMKTYIENNVIFMSQYLLGEKPIAKDFGTTTLAPRYSELELAVSLR